MGEHHIVTNDFLHSILNHTEGSESNILNDIINSKSTKSLLLAWLKLASIPQTITTQKQYLRFLSGQIAILDEIINLQLNVIIHHPLLQEFKARWFSLKLIIDNVDKDSNVIVRLLDINWEEILKDLDRLSFDQSSLFQKIYNKEFGTPGGLPYGLLLGDYYVNIVGKYAARDIEVLNGLSQIAAASFCPFITSVTPESFEIDSFSKLIPLQHIEKVFNSVQYNRWQNFRTHLDSRFIGLTLPRIIVCPPYENNKATSQNYFCFKEEITHSDQTSYCWGNGCFAFGLVVIRSFQENGWFGSITGIKEKGETSGVLSQFPTIENHLDSSHISTKYSIETFISEHEESTLSELGFIPICQYQNHGVAVIYSNVSAHRPMNQHRGNINLEISSKLSYILCACRFAHYIKVMGRDKIGSFLVSKDLERFLNNWLRNYLATNEIDEETRLDYPLQGARVEVSEVPGKPGVYNCIMHLQPRYQLEKVNTALTLVTELAEINSN